MNTSSRNTSSSWRTILRTNIRSLNELLPLIRLPKEHFLLSPTFPLNIPRRLAYKITPGNLQDPILRQFVPLREEVLTADGFSLEPVQDPLFQKSGGLLQKYEARALLISTGACAMHCRYCFRQNYEYLDKSESFRDEIHWIEKNSTIEEVILSGGDPLSLSTRTLQGLLTRIDSIPHVKRIRFHTRFPIGIPERITPHLLEVLSKGEKQRIFIVHINHPKELDDDVLNALKAIQKLGIPLLNQAVLLKGVNDSLEVLQALMNLLINNGIMPYYLHQLDRVAGAAHFEVPVQKGRELMHSLRQKLPGYAIPEYVAEIPGEASKTPL